MLRDTSIHCLKSQRIAPSSGLPYAILGRNRIGGRTSLIFPPSPSPLLWRAVTGAITSLYRNEITKWQGDPPSNIWKVGKRKIPILQVFASLLSAWKLNLHWPVTFLAFPAIFNDLTSERSTFYCCTECFSQLLTSSLTERRLCVVLFMSRSINWCWICGRIVYYINIISLFHWQCYS